MTKYPSHIDLHVGQRLRLRRRQLNLTQQDAAKVLGVTFQQVQKQENATNRVSASALFKLARAMAVPVGFFFEGLPNQPEIEGPDETDLRQFSGSPLGDSLLRSAMALPGALVQGHIILMEAEAANLSRGNPDYPTIASFLHGNMQGKALSARGANAEG